MKLSKELIKEYYLKYHEYVDYVLVGGMTSLVSWGSYALFYYGFTLSNTISSLLSWFCAVVFAFFTNKIFVFRSRSWEAGLVFREASRFFYSRSFTGLLEIGMMYLTVDVWGWNGMLMRIVSSFVSTLINFVLSKFLIFKPR